MLNIKTPIEEYEINNIPVFVKREDLCSPFPGPNNAKIRGIYPFLLRLKEQGIKNVGILDTKISRAGWIVAYCCSKLGLKCYDFFPMYKNDSKLKFQQLMVKAFKGILIPQKAGRESIRYARAKKFMKKIPNSFMLPDMLKLTETVNEVSKIVLSIDKSLLSGSIIVSVGSGTIFTGILKGLIEQKLADSSLFGILCANVSTESRYRNINKLLGYYNFFKKPKVKLINYNYEYLKPEFYDSPFPCDIYYDRKAWRWLCLNVNKLKQPILFWNIGGEWNENGLDSNLRGDGLVSKEQVNKFIKKVNE